MIDRRTLLGSVGALGIGAALTACSTGSVNGGSSSSSTSTSTDAFPVTVKHALGTTTITKAPTRVAVVGWSDPDVLVALGVVPVLVPKLTWGNNDRGSTDWFDAAVKKLGAQYPAQYSDADGIPVDEIAMATPDLVLATNSGVTKDEYAKLTKIAPTVAYPGAAWGTPWQTSLEMIGKAVGRGAQAAALKTKTEQTIAAQAAKYPVLQGKSVAWLSFDDTSKAEFSVYTSIDNRPRLLSECGMATPAYVAALTKAHPTQFYANVSAEKSSTAGSDIALFYVEKAGQEQAIVGDKLFGQIPPIRSGHFATVALDQATMAISAPTPLSIPVALASYLPKLAAAATAQKAAARAS